MGVFAKDNSQGQFVDDWKKTFEKEGFEKVGRNVVYGTFSFWQCSPYLVVTSKTSPNITFYLITT